MKKILPIFVIGFFVVSGFGSLAITKDIAQDIFYDQSFVMKDLIFSKPIIEANIVDQMVISLNNDHEYLMIPGKPMMPKIVKYVELPFGVTDIHIDFHVNQIYEMKISKKIISSPVPVSLNQENNVLNYYTNERVTDPDDIFPKEWFSYNIGVGLNDELERVTFLTEMRVRYNEPEPSLHSVIADYDLLIIAPEEFSADLQDLVDQKNNAEVKTLLRFTEDIYTEVDGRDKPEQIKIFIKNMIEQYNISYVLLVGGLKSLIYAKVKDDTNQGSSDWYVPVRYSNLRVYEPGYLCDLYYADIYKEGGEFDDWDSNGNDIFAEWNNVSSDVLDLYPDVAVGRLACRNTKEVQAVVDKIITYEGGACDPSWFKRIIGITGDSFLDQYDLDFQWDVKSLPDGMYTISAQSTNDEGASGLVDQVSVVLDRTSETNITFNHDDHLQVTSYPALPVAEIVSVSNGNTLGYSNFTYVPSDDEAYCNDFSGWGDIEFVDGVLAIRGKSYDPQLYGNITDIHVWIEDAEGMIVFDEWRNGTKMFAEGDWIVGDTYLHGRGGAMYYMPDDFDKKILSTSNGLFTGIPDVIDALNQGSGFVIFSVHGSPGSVGNHLPGIPGNRHGSYINGLRVTSLWPYPPFIRTPLFPMNQISNDDKLPVVVVSLGCHDSNFNVTMVNSLMDLFLPLSIHTYGHIIPECLSWYFVSLPDTGAIASIGYSGYGWGHLGEWFTVAGLDGWISTEFFRQYGEENKQILGVAHSQAIANYITNFKEYIAPELGDYGWDIGDEMTVEGWVLLGDPSLKIGGYQ
jgi:hypothetical protein